MAIPDAHSETAFVSINFEDGNFLTFQAETETIDIDIGEKGVEWIPNVAGGRIARFNPQEPTTITLEMYPIQAGTATTAAAAGTGVFDWLYTNTTTTQPQVIPADLTRQLTKLVLLWTTKAGVTNATDSLAGTATSSSLRFIFANGYVTSIKPSYTDKVLKFTVEAMFAPFDKSGSPMIEFESVSASTATIAAVSTDSSTTA